MRRIKEFTELARSNANCALDQNDVEAYRENMFDAMDEQFPVRTDFEVRVAEAVFEAVVSGKPIPTFTSTEC